MTSLECLAAATVGAAVRADHTKHCRRRSTDIDCTCRRSQELPPPPEEQMPHRLQTPRRSCRSLGSVVDPSFADATALQHVEALGYQIRWLKERDPATPWADLPTDGRS